MAIWPILLLVGLGAGAYALSQSDGGKKKRAPRLSETLAPPGASDKVEAFKRRVEELKKKAERGDKDAGKMLADLKAAWARLSK